MQDDLWDRLRAVFNKHAIGDEIPTKNVEDVIRDSLDHTSQQDIDYVVKNMFRLDKDASGTVDFEEFVHLDLFRVTSFSRGIAGK